MHGALQSLEKKLYRIKYKLALNMKLSKYEFEIYNNWKFFFN